MRFVKVIGVMAGVVAVLAFQSFGQDQKVVDPSKIAKRGELFYEGNSEIPFTGMTISYFPNGQEEGESEYKGGKQNGKVTLWYENGQKKAETEYRNGILNGKITLWDENGHKKTEIEYQDGKKEGMTTLWYENGQKEVEVEYRDGVEVSRIEWDENGNLRQPCPSPTPIT